MAKARSMTGAAERPGPGSADRPGGGGPTDQSFEGAMS